MFFFSPGLIFWLICHSRDSFPSFVTCLWFASLFAGSLAADAPRWPASLEVHFTNGRLIRPIKRRTRTFLTSYLQFLVHLLAPEAPGGKNLRANVKPTKIKLLKPKLWEKNGNIFNYAIFCVSFNHSPLLLRLPRFFHFCQIYAGQLFLDQPIEVALQGATNKNFITLL